VYTVNANQDQSNSTATSLETVSDLSSYVRQFQAEVAALPTYRPVLAAIIPAYNESDSIEAVLRSLMKQTRLPDEIHVIVNNTKDSTFELAAKFAGLRNGKRKGRDGLRQASKVFVHDIGENPDKKVGALNYGFGLVPHADYLLGVDGDTVLVADAVEKLEAEIVSDTRIGGISAIYSIDDTRIKGIM
jgi:cellulose synthase/poly-beta-1,6-N-acetylglucosamine synthase-like glycosyltransferase